MGWQAQGRFLAESGKAVDWFAAHLAPFRRPKEAQITALIANLDHEDFATREKATAGLVAHWPFTEAALRQTATRPISAEARLRAKRILEEMEKRGASPNELRALRAVEVLEWIGTKEARKVLNGLTRGAPDARVTRQAAATSRRPQGRK